jgi:hypothetical protein
MVLGHPPMQSREVMVQRHRLAVLRDASSATTVRGHQDPRDLALAIRALPEVERLAGIDGYYLDPTVQARKLTLLAHTGDDRLAALKVGGHHLAEAEHLKELRACRGPGSGRPGQRIEAPRESHSK